VGGAEGANQEALVGVYRARRGRVGDGREQWPSIAMADAGDFKAFKGGA
jgi:hypothetical protein